MVLFMRIVMFIALFVILFHIGVISYVLAKRSTRKLRKLVEEEKRKDAEDLTKRETENKNETKEVK